MKLRQRLIKRKKQMQEAWLLVDANNIDNWNANNFPLLNQMKLNGVIIHPQALFQFILHSFKLGKQPGNTDKEYKYHRHLHIHYGDF